MTDIRRNDEKDLADDSALANLSHDHERLKERFRELKTKHKKQDFLNTYLILFLFILFTSKGYSDGITLSIAITGSIIYLITMARWYNFRSVADRLEKWHDLFYNRCYKRIHGNTDGKLEEEFEPRPENIKKSIA